MRNNRKTWATLPLETLKEELEKTRKELWWTMKGGHGGNSDFAHKLDLRVLMLKSLIKSKS